MSIVTVIASGLSVSLFGVANAAEPPPTFVSAWGTTGTGDGQFRSPVNLVVAPDGSIYVADGLNNRIQHFDGDGGFLGAFGSSGSGDGQLSFPNGVAVGASGAIYVADSNNHRVEKFDATGAFVSAWGGIGNGPGQFIFSFGVAVDSSENVYVTDNGNNRVQKFDSSGGLITAWGGSGAGNGQFQTPYDIAIDGSDNVYVTERSGNRVQKFDTTGAFVTTWGSSGSGEGQFTEPLGIGTDDAGNVYVADTDNHRIQKFDGAGTFLTQWGSYGTADGQFSGPRDVAIASTGSIYVADTSNNRIQRFGASNQAPVANAQTVKTPTNTAVGITLTGSDPDGDPMTFAVVTPPSHGALSGTAPTLVYTPAAGFASDDTFTFTTSDGTLTSAPATVTIIVSTPPAGSTTNRKGTEGANTTWQVATFTDPDNEPASSYLCEVSDWGDGSGVSANTATLVSAGSYKCVVRHTYKRFGSYLVQVRVQDRRGGSWSGTLTIRVTDASIDARNILPKSATVTVAFQMVACFSDQNPYGDIADITKNTITWGDGTKGTGTVRVPLSTDGCPSIANIAVVASHTYKKKGTFSPTVKIASAGGSTGTNQGAIKVT